MVKSVRISTLKLATLCFAVVLLTQLVALKVSPANFLGDTLSGLYWVVAVTLVATATMVGATGKRRVQAVAVILGASLACYLIANDLWPAIHQCTTGLFTSLRDCHSSPVVSALNLASALALVAGVLTPLVLRQENRRPK